MHMIESEESYNLMDSAWQWFIMIVEEKFAYIILNEYVIDLCHRVNLTYAYYP